MTTATSPLCTVCQRPENDHPFRHPFTTAEQQNANTDWLGPKDPAKQQSNAAPSFPFDPVLRQALITKGVLTPEDLTAADKMIRAVSGILGGGEPSDQPRPEQGQ